MYGTQTGTLTGQFSYGATSTSSFYGTNFPQTVVIVVGGCGDCNLVSRERRDFERELSELRSAICDFETLVAYVKALPARLRSPSTAEMRPPPILMADRVHRRAHHQMRAARQRRPTRSRPGARRLKRRV